MLFLKMFSKLGTLLGKQYHLIVGNYVVADAARLPALEVTHSLLTHSFSNARMLYIFLHTYTITSAYP